jgi:ADP-ribosylglycohydrolase
MRFSVNNIEEDDLLTAKRNLGQTPYYGITELDYGIIGLAVGDALGVPVEFSLRKNSSTVEGMIGYGTFNMPPGTWSDDTSMALCLADSIAQTGSVDYVDIMTRFLSWIKTGEYTPHGKAFDVGRTCLKAIVRFEKGRLPLECGATGEKDNGNGSLMRILPLVYYLRSKSIPVSSKFGINLIHNISALTHAHPRSKLACVIYCRCAELLLETYEEWQRGLACWLLADKESFLADVPVAEMQKAIKEILDLHQSIPEFAEEIGTYEELATSGFLAKQEDEIASRGYVVDTLKVALWCFWNKHSYRDSVLAAVNLGGDTDTNAAVTGGLAGIWYREDTSLGIPREWRNQLVNCKLLNRVCQDMSYRLGYNKY